MPPPETGLADAIRVAFGRANTVAFGIGTAGFAPWEHQDLARALSETRAGGQVLPVFLPSAPDGLKVPPALAPATWSDLRSPFKQPGWTG